MATKRALAYCFAVLMSIGLYTACNDTVTAQDCSASCQSLDSSCVQKCSDDKCKTQCKADLDNCTASCGSITVSPPSKDGG